MRPFYFSNLSPYANKPFLIEKWKRVDNSVFQYADGPTWVSTFGRVYSETSKSIVEPSINKDGYRTIAVKFVYPDGNVKYQSRTLNRAILLAFDPIDNASKYEANHNNGDKSNNNILNLSWTTKHENNLFAHMNHQRTQPFGAEHYKSKLTDEEVDRICNLLREKISCNDIADMIGCTPQMVSHILNGTTYKDKFMKYKLYELIKPRNMNRLTDEQKENVLMYMKNNKDKFKVRRDLYDKALKNIGLNFDRSNLAFIAYMDRIYKSI